MPLVDVGLDNHVPAWPMHAADSPGKTKVAINLASERIP
jgi:hypothetical protein